MINVEVFYTKSIELLNPIRRANRVLNRAAVLTNKLLDSVGFVTKKLSLQIAELPTWDSIKQLLQRVAHKLPSNCRCGLFIQNVGFIVFTKSFNNFNITHNELLK